MEGVQLLPVGYWAGLILTSSRRAVLPISNLFCFLLMSESGPATELKRIIFLVGLWAYWHEKIGYSLSVLEAAVFGHPEAAGTSFSMTRALSVFLS